MTSVRSQAETAATEAGSGAAAGERLARLLDASPAVVYSFEAKGDFSPTYVSDNITRLFGYVAQEYLDDPDFWRGNVHPDDLARVEAEMSGLFAEGRHACEYRFRRKDGSYCWVNDEQTLVRDADGEPLEVVGSWSEIGSRKAAEEAEAHARERLNGLLESAPSVIYSFKAKDDFAPTFVSENIKRLLGYCPEKRRGCNPMPSSTASSSVTRPIRWSRARWRPMSRRRSRSRASPSRSAVTRCSAFTTISPARAPSSARRATGSRSCSICTSASGRTSSRRWKASSPGSRSRALARRRNVVVGGQPARAFPQSLFQRGRTVIFGKEIGEGLVGEALDRPPGILGEEVERKPDFRRELDQLALEV